jgi:hypothetical protein
MTVRMIVSSAALVLAIAASACAAGPGRTPSGYNEQMDRLAADCRARGGILTPIPAASTGRPETDFACRITGGASRIP